MKLTRTDNSGRTTIAAVDDKGEIISCHVFTDEKEVVAFIKGWQWCRSILAFLALHHPGKQSDSSILVKSIDNFR